MDNIKSDSTLNDTLITKEMNILLEEKEMYQEAIRREQRIFADKLKSGLGERIKEDIRPKSKIKRFFRKLFAIYG